MAKRQCPVCGGGGQVLGKLGKLTWYRCRACGLNFKSGRVSRARKNNPRRARKNSCCRNGRGHARKNRSFDTGWTGKKADFVSRRGNYGLAPHSELSMHMGTAGHRIVRYALFSEPNRWPWVIWAHVMTSGGHVLDGTAGEVLPAGVRRKLGGFGNEKIPMAARLKMGRLDR